MNVIELMTAAQKSDAAALEDRLLGKTPGPGRYRIFGIYDGTKLVAMSRVNLQPLIAWQTDSVHSQLKKLAPDVWIESTAVDPAYQNRGYARALREHLKSKYDRIATSIDKDSGDPMRHLNEAQGFNKVLDRPDTKVFFWEKEASMNKYAAAVIRFAIPSMEKGASLWNKLQQEGAHAGNAFREMIPQGHLWDEISRINPLSSTRKMDSAVDMEDARYWADSMRRAEERGLAFLGNWQPPTQGPKVASQPMKTAANRLKKFIDATREGASRVRKDYGGMVGEDAAKSYALRAVGKGDTPGHDLVRKLVQERPTSSIPAAEDVYKYRLPKHVQGKPQARGTHLKRNISDALEMRGDVPKYVGDGPGITTGEGLFGAAPPELSERMQDIQDLAEDARDAFAAGPMSRVQPAEVPAPGWTPSSSYFPGEGIPTRKNPMTWSGEDYANAATSRARDTRMRDRDQLQQQQSAILRGFGL